MTSSYLISPSDLLPLLGTKAAPVLLDVRRDEAFNASPQMLAGALRCSPQDIASWAACHAALRARTLVVYCVYGHSVSAQACRELRSLGFNALALAGGIKGGEDGVDSASDIAAWRAIALPRSVITSR